MGTRYRDWEANLVNAEAMEDVDLCAALIGAILIALPFAVEYVLMWNTGIITLTRHGAMCPGMVYAVLGLPFVVFLKLWLLLANPFNEAGHTQLSFLGAFDRLDFIVEASVEAPWQTLLNTILFFRD